MSRTFDHFSPFCNNTWWLLGVLSISLDGKAAVELKASKRGLTLRLGPIRARGRDCAELKASFESEHERLNAKIALLRSELK